MRRGGHQAWLYAVPDTTLLKCSTPAATLGRLVHCWLARHAASSHLAGVACDPSQPSITSCASHASLVNNHSQTNARVAAGSVVAALRSPSSQPLPQAATPPAWEIALPARFGLHNTLVSCCTHTSAVPTARAVNQLRPPAFKQHRALPVTSVNSIWRSCYSSSSSQPSSSQPSSSQPSAQASGSASSVDRLLDLRHPAIWYPLARQMRRRIIAHLGPTNSGKTHTALEALKSARSGIYCGPLRLLALEIFERLKDGGVPSRLVTGQELTGEAGATHTSCTVEMASLGQPVEVAVLDEIQMIADQTRGWGWTRALLGLPASTLHVCGAPETLPLLQTLAAECGDELEVKSYKRLSPLVVMNEALGSVSDLQEGDCMVAFSRRSVHGLKREVLRHTHHHCAVVYGALPPSTRRQQAAMFNGALPSQQPVSPDAAPGGCDMPHQEGEVQDHGVVHGSGSPRPHGVLVASDAIGMGLNLNIKRVIFSSMYKFDGTEVRPLSAQEVKQIAGRAGRFRSAHAGGYVTCLYEDDLHLLHKAMATRAQGLETATLMPRAEDISAFVTRHPGLRYDVALEHYASNARLSPHYQLGNLDNVIALATMLQGVAKLLHPEELYMFTVSPADSKDPAVSAALLRFASAFAHEGRVLADLALPPNPLTLPDTEANLKSLEALHRVCDLYIWLAYRFREQFPDPDIVEQARAECSHYIAMGLDKLATSYKLMRKSHQRHGAKENVGQKNRHNDEDDDGWEQDPEPRKGGKRPRAKAHKLKARCSQG